MGSTEEHQRLLGAIRLRIAETFPGRVTVFLLPTGVAQMPGGRVVRYGIKGGADLIGIMAPRGRFLAIEVKTGGAKQSPQQKSFERIVTSRGGLYLVSRSVESVIVSLQSALDQP